MSIGEGIYESLITQALRTKLNALPEHSYFIDSEPLDRAEAASILADHLKTILSAALKHLQEQHNNDALSHQITFCNQLIRYIDQELQFSVNEDLVQQQGEILTAILSKIGRTDEQLKKHLEKSLPISGLRTSNLFTGSNADLSIDTEIERDILSANRIYWIVSFIRWSGIRIFEKALKEFTSMPGSSLQIITTTYMGASEPRAIEFLSSLPNTSIKISYQTTIERLHAKAYIFERNSGYDSAYIGSSNLSRSALTKGLEWNLRVTTRENPHIIDKAKATFEHYWNSIDFENFSEGGIERFRKSLAQERTPSNVIGLREYLKIYPQPFQKEILDRLRAERDIHGRYRNLIVAATGTGKTVISAFDFKRNYENKPESTNLLFVAHRREILKQARATFRAVLGDRLFGELWVGPHKPENPHLRHLFISVQTFNSQKGFFRQRFDKGYYCFIIVDEAHHSRAESYRNIFTLFEPRILLGLTATPERMDGKSLLPDFCNRIAAEIRLPDAMALKLLTPFQYFCVDDDSVDLRNVGWIKGAYDTAELSKMLSVQQRVRLIIENIQHYLSDPYSCKAICFCASKEHARFMSTSLNQAGLKSMALISGDTNDEEDRAHIRHRLQQGEVNYVCVVDIFNEGVDIPEIDTILFLRPTESLTVFLQQLGRGLRISENKEYLTVLDFVSQANQQFNFADRFRALVGRTYQHIEKEIRQGFPHLPSGCSITLEPMAREVVLSNIRNTIFSAKRIRKEIASFALNTHEPLTIHTFLEHHQLDIRTLYSGQKGCWSQLKKDAGIDTITEDSPTKLLFAGMKRLIQIDSPSYLHFIRQLLRNNMKFNEGDIIERRFALMFYYDIFQKDIRSIGVSSIADAFALMRNEPDILQEIEEIVEHLQEKLEHTSQPLPLGMQNILELHAQYSRDEILAAFEKSTPEKKFPSQAGVVGLSALNAELLLVTLNKSDKDFSRETQYEDYAINETLFHWQTQNSASPDTPAGQSYINHRKEKKTLLLFVREHKKDAYGFTMPYHFLGPVAYQSHKGAKPMNIIWELKHPMPAYLWHAAAKMAVG
ncbi:DUF3427 domain-containing protein [Prosthecochloris sp. ZM_2]|uniref:DEAD/DEAH box helicase n=1 Tax=Prosthecochloris sp. ZM_2 TaxID=2045206 RepID=UPI000DF7C31E|nr:DEAD/DEAH box helicase [Prosthecochloris sp. ZM_2]RNA64756.1 DUF3427 domain-containing protein [Prosthecochloris sp. ZM_2]